MSLRKWRVPLSAYSDGVAVRKSEWLADPPHRFPKAEDSTNLPWRVCAVCRNPAEVSSSASLCRCGSAGR